MAPGRAVAALAALAACWLAVPAGAATLSKDFVVDDERFIPDDVERRLEARLRAHHARTTNEVVVMTMPAARGMTIEAYAKQVFNTRGIGRADRDNGVLVFITPADRKLRIQVGSGLESEITNAEAKAIIDGRMVPALRAGDPGRAVTAGVEGVLGELGDPGPLSDGAERGDAGSVSPAQDRVRRATSALRGAAPVVFVVLVVGMIALASRAVRGVTGVIEGDHRDAPGYGRGVWFGKHFGPRSGAGFHPPLISDPAVDYGSSFSSSSSSSSSGSGGGSTSGGGASGSW